MAEESLKITLSVENKAALEALKKTAAELGAVEVAGGKAGNAAGKLGKDFTGVSRVIQDLPYGFNAISNNLTQLVPAAGLAGVAFSGIITALTFAQIGFGAWTRGMGASKEATEAATKANDEYIQSLAKERVNLDTLFTTATNANVPMAARLNAVKELRDNYGAYLKNFSDEAIMAGNATSAYNELTNAIVKSARARAAQNLMVSKQEELLKLEQDSIKAKETAEKELAMAPWRGAAQSAQVSGLQYSNADLQIAGQRASAYNKLNAALTENGAKVAAITKEMQLLQAQIQQNTVAPMKLDKETGAEPKPKFNGKDLYYMEKMKEYLPILERFNAARASQVKQLPITAAPGRMTQTQGKEDIKLQIADNNTLNALIEERKVKQELIEKQIRESQAGVITDYLMNSFTGLVTAMQNGANIGDALGSMFQKLAQDIAMAAAKALILQTILSLLPTGGFAASGSGFVRSFGKMLGFASGGTVSGPTTGYPVMLHGTEHIVRPDQMKSIIASAAQMGGSGASKVVVEGRIQGQDIWLSQQRTNTFRGLTT